MPAYPLTASLGVLGGVVSSSSVASSRCFLRCRSMLCFRVKRRRHRSQANGRSPECVRMWRRRSSADQKRPWSGNFPLSSSSALSLLSLAASKAPLVTNCSYSVGWLEAKCPKAPFLSPNDASQRWHLKTKLESVSSSGFGDGGCELEWREATCFFSVSIDENVLVGHDEHLFIDKTSSNFQIEIFAELLMACSHQYFSRGSMCSSSSSITKVSSSSSSLSATSSESLLTGDRSICDGRSRWRANKAYLTRSERFSEPGYGGGALGAGLLTLQCCGCCCLTCLSMFERKVKRAEHWEQEKGRSVRYLLCFCLGISIPFLITIFTESFCGAAFVGIGRGDSGSGGGVGVVVTCNGF
ncbi:unnamed protein product [Leptidea sinapis]|uniref:Uncharacterized protein n=1 Tax=Leptidea sinapis TaxID=189913 RepID=A0A5E4QNR6_9NEOP|nr:unnamed protein product [Leptidea sinapis]